MSFGQGGDLYGNMTPGSALGGGLAMPGNTSGMEFTEPKLGVLTGNMNQPGLPFGGQPAAQQMSQQFPNLMQNPAFNPGMAMPGNTSGQEFAEPNQQLTAPQLPQAPQMAQQPMGLQLQQIAQGVPSLVNLLTPQRQTLGAAPETMSLTTAPRNPPPAPRFPNLMGNPYFNPAAQSAQPVSQVQSQPRPMFQPQRFAPARTPARLGRRR